MTTAQDTREAFVQGLVDAGEKGIAGEDRAWLDAYFAPEFTFHGPDGAELDYAGLQGFWAALRAAFDDLTITRGIMVVEGNYIACQTTISGILPASSPTRPSVRCRRTASVSSWNSSTSSGTTTRAASSKSGSRPTNAASCASSAPRAAET